MRRPVFILLILLAVLLLVVLALPFLINANQFRPAIENELTKSLGRDVKIGDLKLGVWSGTVAASDLSVADDPSFSRMPFLTTKRLTLSIELLPALFSRKLNITGIRIDTPEIVLIQAPSGLWNFSSMGSKTAPRPQQAAVAPGGGNLALSIDSLKIDHARVSVNRGAAPQILENVNVVVSHFAPGSVFPFSLSGQIRGGGDVALDGKAGPIDSSNAANTPLTASLKLTKLNLAGSGTVPASSGIDGLLSADGTASSNGHEVLVKGRIQAEKLKLAPGATATRNPLLFDVDLTGDLAQRSGYMNRGDVSIGGVKGTLTGGWSQQGATPVLNLVFSAPGVPVSAVVDLLPALDIVLPAGTTLEGGTATATLNIAGSAAAPVIAGPVGLQNTRLRGFDLGAKMSPIEKLAGFKSGPNMEIQTLSTNLRIAPDGTTLQNIRMVLPAVGQLTGDGTISRSQALNFRMRAALQRGTLASAVAPASIPFSIVGTSSNPQFRPDTGQLAAEELSQRLKGVKVGGVDAGKTADSVLKGLFGGKKKKK